MKKFFKITLKTIGGIILLALILGVFTPNKNNSSTNKQTSTKQKLEKANVKILDFKDNTKTSNQILVYIKVQSPKKRLLSYNTTKVVKEVYKDYKNKGLKRIDVVIQADYVDKYGNQNLKKTCSATFDTEEVKKINWEHFNFNAIFDIATNTWFNDDIK